MQLERTENGFQIDAVALGPLLGVAAEDVQRLMREGRIVSLCEEGRGADSGRHRITFRHGATRVRLTVNDGGEVLMRTRTTVAPSPGPQARIGAEAPGAPRPGSWPDIAKDDGPADLTRHIERRFHARHRRRIAEIGKLAEMVEDLHEGDDGVPAGLRLILERMNRVLEAHMQSTETVVFPAIRKGMTSSLAPRIDALRGDRERLSDDFARIRIISRDFALPDGACTSWATLYSRVAEFITDLEDHIRLENDVLFPQFETEGATHD